MAKMPLSSPSSSAFSELFRRSRFASYDPSIPQTYSSPQAHARRGDYGLKRPLPITYKDSYITVSHVEHHANFTDWNNAAPLVNFVNHVQELNITPRTPSIGPWDQALGDAKLSWLIDSEFAFQDQHEPYDGLGLRGARAYGAKRPPPQQPPGHVSPNTAQLNIMSLSPRKFKSYLSKLPALSDSYKHHLWGQQKALLPADQTSFQRDHNVLYVASQPQFNTHKFHRPFLAKHFSATSPPISTHKIKKNDHPYRPCQPKRRAPTPSHWRSHVHSLLSSGNRPYHFPSAWFRITTEPTLATPFFADKNRNRQNQNQNYLSLIGGIVAPSCTDTMLIFISLLQS